MTKWCTRFDKALDDNDNYNQGCTDEWGKHHSCKECPHNKYMGDNGITYLTKNYGKN